MRFEADRIFRNRNIITIMAVFIVLSVLTTALGVFDFNNYEKQKGNFLKFEKKKDQQYNSYEFYGALGIRVRLGISPLSIFFKNIEIYETNIDTSEIISVWKYKRGSSFFHGGNSVNFSFSDLMYLISLIFLYFGITTFGGINDLSLYKKSKQILTSVFYRLLIFEGFLIFLFLAAFLETLVLGVKFTAPEISGIIQFCLYTALFQALFFLGGVVINIGKIKNKILLMLIVWFTIIILIPGLINRFSEIKSNQIKPLEQLHFEKFSALNDFERDTLSLYKQKVKEKNFNKNEFDKEVIRKYESTVFVENMNRENDYIEQEKKIVKYKQDISVFSPMYFQYLSTELSGNGDENYIRFLEFIAKRRMEFAKYIFFKRHIEKAKNFVQFCPIEKNILEPEIKTPANFFLGIFLNIVLLLFLIASIIKITKKPVEKSSIDLEPNESYFQFFESDVEMNKASERYEQMEGITCLWNKEELPVSKDKININIVARHFSRIRKVTVDSVEKNLKEFGINTDLACADKKTVKIIMASIVLADSNNKIVIVDFAKGEGRELDQNLRTLLNALKDEGKTILYLSTQFPEAINKREKKEDIGKGMIISIDIMDFTFR